MGNNEIDHDVISFLPGILVRDEAAQKSLRKKLGNIGLILCVFLTVRMNICTRGRGRISSMIAYRLKTSPSLRGLMDTARTWTATGHTFSRRKSPLWSNAANVNGHITAP